MDNQITIVDLAQIRSIIETACSRGAFQASEMRVVGEVYDRLTSFLNSVMSEAKVQQGEQTGDLS